MIRHTSGQERLFCWRAVKNKTLLWNTAQMWENVSVFVGQCQCGQCTCHPPGDSRVHGKNCECDDRQCEDISGEVCGGESAHTHTHIQRIFVSIKGCSSCMSHRGNWQNNAINRWQVYVSTLLFKLYRIEKWEAYFQPSGVPEIKVLFIFRTDNGPHARTTSTNRFLLKWHVREI